ncbi:methyl-accepting chemotaxis protein, partial [Jiella marina]|uniref:methyl-accepting chemotaxis protein n=1 Tax=Jiella sp. LLJ827 TaxID=2917712 RepID=UPI00350E563B|nr:hypothetical protein [Jiella sp. LLJ827]
MVGRNEIDIHRARLLKAFVWVLSVCPLVVLAVEALTGAWEFTSVFASAAIAAVAFVLWRRESSAVTARIVASIALVANISLILAAMSGNKLQVDIHMAYFAGLALIGAMFDWRSIIAATVTVALHHIILNFLLPSAIYPGGSDFVRLMLHASILLIEAGVLTWVAVRVSTMFADITRAGQSLEAEHLKSEEANRAAATLRDTQAREAAKRVEEDKARTEGLVAFMGVVDASFDRLSSGDLTVRMSSQVASEFEPIRAKFNASVEELEQAIGHVVGSVGTIRTGLSEITVASNDLAHRTEQQAANLEQTVAALGEVTSGVNQTAEGAGAARKSAETARTKAEKGGQIVAQAVTAMNEIETSS